MQRYLAVVWTEYCFPLIEIYGLQLDSSACMWHLADEDKTPGCLEGFILRMWHEDKSEINFILLISLGFLEKFERFILINDIVRICDKKTVIENIHRTNESRA